jgi:hypothetical protein
MIKKQKIIFCFLIILLLPFKINAQSVQVVVNEICWAGSAQSPVDEWIELYNLMSDVILLNGWVLKSLTRNFKIELQGEIAPKNFFLLERGDDQSAAGILASQIYQGVLNNQGDNLILQDANGNIVDQVDSSLNWQAGDNETKQTMSLLADETGKKFFLNSKSPGGTPGRINDFVEQGQKNQLGAAKSLRIEEINKNFLGQTLITEGQIIEKNGLKLFLAGITSSEIIVYIPEKKKDILPASLAEGDYYRIQGLLAQNRSGGLQLLPQSREDFIFLKPALSKLLIAPPEHTIIKIGQVSGHNTEGILGYLQKSLLVIFLLLVFLFILKKKIDKEGRSDKIKKA